MIFDKFYNGIGRSEYDQDGFHTLVSCDIRSDLGKVKASLALTKESGTTVTEFCRIAVVVPSGDSFWFSEDSGKIWKRTSGGVWSLAHTNSVGACDGAGYYNLYVYYVSGATVGRFLATDPTDVDDTWNTLLVSADHAPMVEQNLQLFIGNSRYVASVNSSATFNSNALDLPYGQSIKTLATYESDLIIGTKVASDVNQSGVFRWDTYSDSWTVEDYAEENGINTFIKTDNNLMAQVGRKANIYLYTGTKLEKFTELRDADNTFTFDTLPCSSSNLSGVSLLATSRGIYSIARHDSNSPYSSCIEYVSSVGQSITPGALLVIGMTVMLAWKSGSTYGVDKIDTNRATATIITPIAQGSFNTVEVKYSSLPTGTSISIYTKVDGGDWTQQTVITDTINKICYFDGGLGTINTLQAKILLNPSTTSTPEIEYIEIK